jgi:formate hydrogenlyase transcriptional activator
MFIDITGRVLAEQEQARLRAQNLYLQEEIKSVHNFEEIVGRSPALLRALEKVARVAGTDSTVLVTGETGTGKELIARAIHSASRRHERPLIKLNCAALPMGLVESELFGHEKGAFSGALQRRIGRFELANGGTLFLDEVGKMPLDAQVKLLRVLQEGEFERVGGSETHRTDVRIIAATNRDLQRAVSEGAFREDLYYRLNVFPVALPPLRERRGDIPLLERFFIGKYAARVDRRIEAVEPEIFVAALPAPSPAVGAAPDLDLDHLHLDSSGPPLAPARGDGADSVDRAPAYDMADPVYQS